MLTKLFLYDDWLWWCLANWNKIDTGKVYFEFLLVLPPPTTCSLPVGYSTSCLLVIPSYSLSTTRLGTRFSVTQGDDDILPQYPKSNCLNTTGKTCGVVLLQTQSTVFNTLVLGSHSNYIILANKARFARVRAARG